MVARARRQFATQRNRRRTVWAREFQTITPVASGTPQHHDVLNSFKLTSGVATVGATVGRVRLDVMVTNTAAGGNTPHVFAGLLVAGPDDDVDDHIPSGTNQRYLDWMWWRKLYTSLGSPVGGFPTASYEIDVKSMRKLDEVHQTLWFVATSTVGTYDVSYGASVLLLLP